MSSDNLDRSVRDVLTTVGRSFQLDREVGGRPLGDLLESSIREAAAAPEVEFGSPGRRTELHESSGGVLSFYYRPHLFPDMDPSLRLGHLVQYHLLPRDLPERSPIEAAAMLESYCHLSGDLFGWQGYGKDDLTLWLLDVSGHGVRAGFAAVIVKLLLADTDPTLPVTALAESVERRFLDLRNPDDEGALYATGAFIRISDRGKVDYLSAGHPPLLVRRGNGAIDRFEATGVPLALVPEVPKREETFEVGGDDVVLVCSDGLLELRDADGREFGIELTAEIFARSGDRPTSVVESLARSIEGFHDLSRLDDDLSFVALRLKQ
jgi:sigma-B regulation protein RsbU (phosphoserine phosphatase)